MTTRLGISILLASFFTLAGCEDSKPSTEGADKKEASEKKGDEKPAEKAEDKPAEKAEAPACDKVVDTIASFNEGSGDAERKLWGKMCDEMTPEQRTCVAAAKDMAGMEACMGAKGDEKLK